MFGVKLPPDTVAMLITTQTHHQIDQQLKQQNEKSDTTNLRTK